MIAIIPIFFINNSKFWMRKDGTKLLIKTLRSLQSSSLIKKCFVFSDKSSFVNLAQSVGLSSYKIDVKENNSKLLPHGTFSSVKYIRDVLKLNFENLMVLSFRNPFITTFLIDNAINSYNKSSKNILISIKESIDHPCQLQTYYKLLDVGFIHLFDNDETITPYLQILNDHFYKTSHNKGKQCNPINMGLNQYITKPFYFDWQSRAVHEKSESGIYVRVYNELDMNYISIEDIRDDNLPKIPSIFWIYEGQNTARILYKRNIKNELFKKASKTAANYLLAGTSFSEDSIFSTLFKDLETDKYYLIINSEEFFNHQYTIRMLPVGNSNQMGNDIIEIKDFSNISAFTYQGRNDSGIIYFLLEDSEDDVYDLCEEFPHDEKLWKRDISTKNDINLVTGNIISGRHDFPDVFEPEGTFFIIRKDLISSFDSEILNANVDGFIMDETNSIQISSEIDLLRYNAIIRAKDDQPKMC